MEIKLFDFVPFFVVAALTVSGQICIKVALEKYGVIPEPLNEKVGYFSRVLLEPLVILGFILAFSASLFWLAIMSKFDLSYAYPYMIGCLTLATAASGFFFLEEPISKLSVIGTLFIVVGVLLMSFRQ